MGEAKKAAKLADEAVANDFRPQASDEWLPVLFAYANSDQPMKLRHASTYINDKYTRWYLCNQLKSVKQWPAGYKPDSVIQNLCVANWIHRSSKYLVSANMLTSGWKRLKIDFQGGMVESS